MPQGHDFKAFPELTNNQMNFYYFESPHKQITEDFRAKVVKVTDGDTVRVSWKERDFDFPIRLARIAAPELNEVGGIASQKFLSRKVLGEEVTVKLTKQRVEKWGRLLAELVMFGMSVGEESINLGHAVRWDARVRPAIPEFKGVKI